MAGDKQTAKQALEILTEKGYRVLDSKQKRNLCVAFARAGKALFGSAYDAVRMPEDLDPNDAEALEHRLNEITVCEVKSTANPKVQEGFKGFFFSLTTAELLVAQSLGEQHCFVFVNTRTKEVLSIGLKDLYARARAVYPVWSVHF